MYFRCRCLAGCIFVVCIVCGCVFHLLIVLSKVSLVASYRVVVCTLNVGGVIILIMRGVIVSDNVTKRVSVFWFGRRTLTRFVMGRLLLVLGFWIMC